MDTEGSVIRLILFPRFIGKGTCTSCNEKDRALSQSRVLHKQICLRCLIQLGEVVSD